MARESKYGKVTVERSPTPIPEDEPVFLLRAQDRLAVAAVEGYANLRAAAGDVKGAQQVREAAEAMRAWPVKKMPD